MRPWSCSLGEWHHVKRPLPQRDSKSIVYISKSSPKWLNVWESWEVLVSYQIYQISEFTIGTSLRWNLEFGRFNNLLMIENIQCAKKVTLLGFHWYQEILLEALRQDWHLLKHLRPTKKNSTGCWGFLGIKGWKCWKLAGEDELYHDFCIFLWLKWCWDRMPEIQLSIFFETCSNVVWLLRRLMHFGHLH